MTVTVDAVDEALKARIDELRDAVREAATPAEAHRYRLAIDQLVLEERGPEVWLRTLYPAKFPSEFAPHHSEFWAWVWSIRLGVSYEAFVLIWNRGAAKSTNMESAVVTLGARGRRRYFLYVCDTQDRADDHVTNMALMLEHPNLARLYPSFSRRRISKYGPPRGWRRNRLWTETGFVIDALGLDKAVRGVKLEDQRPDGFVFDDIDNPLDNEGAIRRKLTIITRNILPAGTSDAVSMAGQNLIHPEGVFARLADLVPEGAAHSEFLTNRIVSGPLPAAEGLVIERQPHPTRPGRTRATIIAGEATWVGKDIPALQAELDTYGESAFRAEFQHEVDRLEGAMFEDVLPNVRRVTVSGPDRITEAEGIDGLRELLGRMVRTTVWCDPAVTEKDASDAYGIQADGIDDQGDVWRLHSWEQRSSPRGVLKQAIRWAYELGAGEVGVETDQGGDTWYDTFDLALADVLAEDPELARCWCGHLPVTHLTGACSTPECVCTGIDPAIAPPVMLEEKAGAGHGPKQERGARMLADYERDSVIHVYGYPDDSTALDSALGRVFVRKPFDLADAAYWSWRWLRVSAPPTTGAEAAASLGPIRRR